MTAKERPLEKIHKVFGDWNSDSGLDRLFRRIKGEETGQSLGP